MTTMRRLLLALVFAAPALAADGDLDPTFSGDGKVVFGTAATDPFPHDALLGPDGALVVVGYGRSGDQPGLDWRRVTAAGAHAACTFVPPNSTLSWANAGVFDGSGRLLVAGFARYDGLGEVAAVARYLYPACTLDTSFDGDGYATYDESQDLRATDLTISRYWSGIFFVSRIVLAGPWGDPNATPFVAVLSLRFDGTLDTGFDDDGLRLLNFGGDVMGTRVVASGARILVGATREIGNEGDFSLFALGAEDGALDTSWGDTGTRLIDFGDGAGFDDDELWAMALDRAGRLLLAGTSSHDGVSFSPLARLDPAGDPDPTLDGDGELLLPYTSVPLTVTAVAEQSDGKLVLGGGGSLDGEGAAGALRLHASGAVDPSYGAGGLALHVVDVYPSASGESTYPDAAVIWGGRTTLVGGSQQPQENRGFVVRLTAALVFRDGFEHGSTATWNGF